MIRKYIYSILRLGLPKLCIHLAVMLSIVGMGCEDVIQMDLEEVEPRIVIEAKVTDRDSRFKVMITKTVDYDDQSVSPRVTGALVEITDDRGWYAILEEVEPGLYVNLTSGAAPYLTYTVTVTVDGITYTATSEMPKRNRTTSVRQGYHDDDSYDLEKGYYLTVTFRDEVGIDDYYRINLKRNGVMVDEYSLHDGAFLDGRVLGENWGGFELGDTILVELQAIDEQTYDYFRTLSGVIAAEEVDEPNWSPVNPITNWDNGALGYFSAMSVDIIRVIIKQ